jgi:hypothetical protein
VKPVVGRGWPIPYEEIDERRARCHQQMTPATLTGDGT